MSRILAILVLLSFAACGSLRSPTPALVAPPVDVIGTTTLTVVEGRPSGVVLRMSTTDADATSLELYRVLEEADPQLLQRIVLDDALRTGLATGVELVDATVVPHHRFSYQLFAIGADDEVLERSEIVSVAWAPPPPRPAELVAVASFSDAVELSWQRVDRGFGAIVFRRDVLGDGGFERVATVSGPATQWVDRRVSPAGVWSYRIALALEHPNGFVQFGAPSEEVYASTPEAR